CGRVKGDLAGQTDLAMVFFSVHHMEAAEQIATEVQNRLTPRCLLGCTGEAIVGNDQEVEEGPALSIWAGSWSGQVALEPFRLMLEQTPDGYSLLGWPDSLMQADPGRSAVLLLADPYTFPIDAFLAHMNEHHQRLRVMGGMASGSRRAEQTRLL